MSIVSLQGLTIIADSTLLSGATGLAFGFDLLSKKRPTWIFHRIPLDMALFPSIPDLTPEYLDFNIAPHLLSVSGSLTALALLVFLLRAYVRTVMLRFFGLDDAFMLVAVVSGAIPSAVALSTHG
jgi:hypothetical protein